MYKTLPAGVEEDGKCKLTSGCSGGFSRINCCKFDLIPQCVHFIGKSNDLQY